MDLQEFVSKFFDCLDDVSAIDSSTEFKYLDSWSSMNALAVIAMVDANYGVQIDGDDIRKADTIEDLFVRVKELKG